MLSLLLYEDERLSMYVGWLGMGAVVVEEKGLGKRRAHPIQKRFLTALNDRLLARGAKLQLSDPHTRRVYGIFSRMIFDHSPNSLVWQVAYQHGPAGIVEEVFEASAPNTGAQKLTQPKVGG